MIRSMHGNTVEFVVVGKILASGMDQKKGPL